ESARIRTAVQYPGLPTDRGSQETRAARTMPRCSKRRTAAVHLNDCERIPCALTVGIPPERPGTRQRTTDGSADRFPSRREVPLAHDGRACARDARRRLGAADGL